MNRADTHRSPLLVSGQESRKFRKKLAWSSDRLPNAVQTLKFKLDCSEVEAMPKFGEYRKLYDAIEGVGKGTLTYFLFTLINSGFCVFATAPEASSYAARDAFDDVGFANSVKQYFDVQVDEFTPTNIVLRFQKLPRSTGGKDISFTESVIYEEYRKFLCGQKEVSENLDEFFHDVAAALAERFSGWKEVRDAVPEAARVFDSVLRKYGEFPSIEKMAEASEVSLPEYSTVAFNSRALKADPDESLNPYMAVAAILQDFEWGNGGDAVKYVQNHLTTVNSNGLAWLFSKGLEIFAKTPLTSAEDSLSGMFAVPESQVSFLKNVQEAARPLAEQKIMLRGATKSLGFNDFRSAFGGHIDSWVANYLNRLAELGLYLSRLPVTLEIPACLNSENGDFFAHSGLNRSEAELITASFAETKARANESLNVLLGMADHLPTKQDVENIQTLTSLVNRFNAIRRSLKNAVEQASKDDGSPWKNLKDVLPKGWIDSADVERLPKLNGLSGGVPEEEKLLQQCLSDFVLLKKAQQQVYSRVMAWSHEQDAVTDLFETLEEKEERDLKKRPGQNVTAEEQAVRRLLNDIARTVMHTSDEAACTVKQWFVEKTIFLNTKDCNLFFHNRKGLLYKSVFSTKKNSAYAVNPLVFKEKRVLWQDFGRLIDEMAEKYSGFSEEQATVLSLQKLWMNYHLRSIQMAVPKDVAEIVLPESYGDALTDEMGALLDQEFVPVSVFIQAFNLYTSLLNGINTQLRRNRFYLRTKFSWLGNNSLIYRPKFDRSWNIPERYGKSPEWQTILASGMLVKNDDGSVSVEKTFEKLHALKDSEIQKYSLLLQQLPHDWGFENPFIAREKKAPVRVLELAKKGSKGMQLVNRTVSAQSFLRLIGPSSFKTQLDQMLLDPKRVTVGDMMLLADEAVNQKISEGRVHLEAEEPMLSLAMPLTITGRPKDAEKPDAPFTHLVGIDQGEAGLAYAVFKLDDAGNVMADPVDCGTVRIPSIRRLIKGVNKYRKGKQRTAKFNQRFDSTQFNIRENVTGDVCHAIVGLMEKYNAFPVLEFQVKNLESGSKQLSLVYKAVNSHFLYSDVDAHSTLRKQMWYSASAWSVPGLIHNRTKFETNKKGQTVEKKESKPLKVWPGVSVNAWHTSRICSCCGNNISELIARAKKEKSNQKIVINDQGEVVLYDHVVKLYGPDRSHDAKYYRRRNERAPLTTPWRASEVSLKEFEDIVKKNLRRAPKSFQSKDTSQSRYFCVFKDCEKHNQEQHADVNAAINIGRRFLGELSKEVKS